MKTANLSQIMKSAWRFFRITGECFSESLKRAWSNFKLVQKMQKGITKFYFQKVDGSIREAWGTLSEKMIPTTAGTNSRPKKRHSTSLLRYRKTRIPLFQKIEFSIIQIKYKL